MMIQSEYPQEKNVVLLYKFKGEKTNKIEKLLIRPVNILSFPAGMNKQLLLPWQQNQFFQKHK